MELRSVECRVVILVDLKLAQFMKLFSDCSRSLVYSFSVSRVYCALEELAEELFAVRAQLARVFGGVSNLFKHELELVQVLVFVLACHVVISQGANNFEELNQAAVAKRVIFF
jgi:hypothetical protein